MKKIGHLLQNRKLTKKTPLDDKSLFYIFDRIIKEEYGNRGIENIKAEYLKGKKLFIKADNSNWANEIWLNRNNLIEKMNREIGSEEIDELSL
ncbi:MAG: hypothetical protein UY41_C0005G0028 [Candidatus Moranbacteria bacterium GW2011_GWE1_49_15]|nr:MAG: hypothetical protein UX75_C0001G0033 [Candidatus Moranbacteria bacterium GW2011_GWE2_47_10]KKW07351.1 MAG: hypothetical protein UY41_C0005G0028 [Candidatus Moranbacteria bacterium GW2011_GWE1_49_15]HBP00821.1 hypothetical protein [Candidatus Moranbacteria bacterium]